MILTPDSPKDTTGLGTIPATSVASKSTVGAARGAWAAPRVCRIATAVTNTGVYSCTSEDQANSVSAAV